MLKLQLLGKVDLLLTGSGIVIIHHHHHQHQLHPTINVKIGVIDPMFVVITMGVLIVISRAIMFF